MMAGEDPDPFEDPDLFADLAPLPVPQLDGDDGAAAAEASIEDVDVNAGDIELGVAAMMPAVRQRGTGEFRGHNCSRMHMAFVRKSLMVKRAIHKTRRVVKQYKGLKRAWDQHVLRVGDQTQDADCDGHQDSARGHDDSASRKRARPTHLATGEKANEWTIEAVVRVGFCSVGGKRNVGRHGIVGTHNDLEACSGLACAACNHQIRALEARLMQDKRSHVILRHYDATPSAHFVRHSGTEG